MFFEKFLKKFKRKYKCPGQYSMLRCEPRPSETERHCLTASGRGCYARRNKCQAKRINRWTNKLGKTAGESTQKTIRLSGRLG